MQAAKYYIQGPVYLGRSYLGCRENISTGRIMFCSYGLKKCFPAYSMLSSFRTVPVFGQIVPKAYFLREKQQIQLDGVPMIARVLMNCYYAHLSVLHYLRRKRKSLKKMSKIIFSKSMSYTATKNIHHCSESQFSKISSQNYAVFA